MFFIRINSRPFAVASLGSSALGLGLVNNGANLSIC